MINKKIKSFKRKFIGFSGVKIFGIGSNKTGTTSLTSAIKSLGYVLGAQGPAERMLED